MPLNFEELSRKFNASGVVCPAELINNVSKYPKRTVIANSVSVEDFLIPGIFYICPESDIKFFKIMKSPPEPGGQAWRLAYGQLFQTKCRSVPEHRLDQPRCFL